jgi:CRISPR/Cas system-associated exonuclease Cas4 (RecB family)
MKIQLGRALTHNANMPPTLTASEIGTFAFCPQAWYLQRMRAPATRAAEERRRIGSDLHRKIGSQTDLVRVVAAVQAILLFVVALGLLALMALSVTG